MQKTALLWIFGILFLAALVGMAYFWHVNTVNESVLQSRMDAQSMANGRNGTGEASQAMPEEKKSLTVDEITNGMKSDDASDQSALNTEESAEEDHVESGGSVVNDLGTSYDETKY